MKKSLLALAVLGAFAGAATAQSSVTIYGLVDLGVAKGNGGSVKTAGLDLAPNKDGKAWVEKASNASRLGFRGNEDLGGGLSAQFQIEHRFNADEGVLNSKDFFWAGRTYVQLTSATAGSIYLGREYSPAFFVQSAVDPFGNNGVGQFGTDLSWAGYKSPSNAGGTVVSGGSRSSNAVGYKSPNLNGFSAIVAVGLGEGVVPRTTALSLDYKAGPIYAGFGYEKQSGKPGFATNDDSLWNIGATYDLGMVKPGFYYASAKVTGGTLTNKVFEFTASAPIGGGTLKAGYGRESFGAVAPATKGKLSKFGLGYDYPLSKRTNLYADLGTARQGDDVSGTTKVTYTNSTQYHVGVTHKF